MTNVRDTSITVYHKRVATGVLKGQALQIVGLLRKDDMTRRELADAMGNVPSSITGAISKLIDMDLIHEVGKIRVCPATGNHVLVYRLGPKPLTCRSSWRCRCDRIRETKNRIRFCKSSLTYVKGVLWKST